MSSLEILRKKKKYYKYLYLIKYIGIIFLVFKGPTKDI